MMDEQELSRAMDDAVGGVRPQTHTLVERATRTGRQLRVRRRLAAGAAVFAVTGAVLGTSVFGAYLPTYAGEVTSTLPSAPDGGPGEVTVPDFSGRPRPVAPSAGKEWLSGRATVQILKELLPGKGGTSDYEGQSAPAIAPGSGTFGRLSADGWLAGSEVQVNFQPGFGRSLAVQGGDLQGFYSCGQREPEGTMTACGVTELADGSVLMLYEDRSGLLLRRHADLLRTDGTRISVGTTNGVDIEDGPVIGSQPPFSLDELRAVVTSPRWQMHVDREVNERAKELTPYKDRTQVLPADGSDPVDDRGRTADESPAD